MKKNTIIVILLIFYSTNNTEAQQLKKGTKVWGTPDWVALPDGSIPNIISKSKKHPTLWMVYSDKDNNHTTTSPGGLTVNQSINFMDAFFVIDVKDNKYFQLIKYDYGALKDAQSGEINPNNAKYVGWATISDLLLWKTSLVNPVTKVSRKALTVISDADAVKHPEKYLSNGTLIKFYNDPARTRPNDKNAKMFNFLYIYKEDLVNQSLLIGKAEYMDADMPKSHIMGWVSKNIVVEWGLRVCLEPNTNSTNARERKEKSIKASMFFSSDEAISFKNGGNEKACWEDDGYEKTLKPSYLRFPVLKFDSVNQIAESGFCTGVMDKKGHEVLTSEDHANTRKIHSELRAKRRKFNYIFVTSGRENVRHLYSGFKETIERLQMEINQDKESPRTYKFGGVIYGSSDCKLPLDVQELDPNGDQVITFFVDKSTKENNCKGTSLNDGLMDGITRALRMFSKYENNIIVLLGATADTKSKFDSSLTALSESIADLNVSFIGLQGTSPGIVQDEYLNFNEQMREILRSSCRSSIKKINDSKLRKDLYSKKIGEPVYDNNLYKRYFALPYRTTSPLAGAYVFPNSGSSLSTIEIVATVDSITNNLQDFIELAIITLESKIDGIGKDMITLNPLLLRMFGDMGDLSKTYLPKDYNEDNINKYFDDNFQFFLKAYIPLKNSKLNSNTFSFQLFVTSDELGILQSQLNKLAKNGIGGNEERGMVHDAFNQIIKTYYGGKETQNMALSQVMSLITGLPSTSRLLQNHTVADLESTKAVTPQEFRDIVNHIKDKSRLLEELKTDENRSFRFADNYYYWVPQEYLP